MARASSAPATRKKATAGQAKKAAVASSTKQKAGPKSKPTPKAEATSKVKAISKAKATSKGKKTQTVKATAKGKAAPKSKAVSVGKAKGSIGHVVVSSHETPYERLTSSEKEYATQELANAAVLEMWNEYKSEYQLEGCRLYKNKAGYCKFFMRGQEGTETTLEARPKMTDLSWELAEVGASEDPDAWN